MGIPCTAEAAEVFVAKHCTDGDGVLSEKEFGVAMRAVGSAGQVLQLANSSEQREA
jgi:hypothetical protein